MPDSQTTKFLDLVRALMEVEIAYCTVSCGSGVALAGEVFTTTDIVFMIRPEDLDQAVAAARGLGYLQQSGVVEAGDLAVQRLFQVGDGEELTIVNLLLARSDAYQQILANSTETQLAGLSVRLAQKDDQKRLQQAHEIMEAHLKVAFENKTH